MSAQQERAMKKTVVVLIFLTLTGCSNMKPVDLCLETGVLMGLISVDLCGKVGDGEFNPEVDIEKADEG